MRVFKIRTDDPSGSGYVGTLRLENRHVYTCEPPYQAVQCLAVEIEGWSVWGAGRTATAFLTADQAARLRDALNEYLKDHTGGKG